MAKPDNRRERVSAHTLLIAACFLLPTVFPLLFAWFNMLLAVPVFLVLQTAQDEQTAVAQLRNALFVAAIGTLLIGEPASFVFSLTILPVGWSMHRSANSGLTPTATGGVGLVVLGLIWIIFWLVQGLLTGSNPYADLLAVLDSSFVQAGEAYRFSTVEMPQELLHEMEIAANWMRGLLPNVLPGLLASSVLLTVWLNLVIANGLLRRLRPEKAIWPEYRYWRLPEPLIWLLIAAIVLSLIGSGSLEQTGYSLTILAAILYFFQGAAIFAHLLHRWNVPTFWRLVLYFFVAVQGYGVVLLTVIGVADTWADFRRLIQPINRS